MDSQTLRCRAALVFVACVAFAAAAHANRAFQTPEEAMTTFGEAVTANDTAALEAILGNGYRQFVPPPGAWVRERFVAAWSEGRAVRHDSEQHATLVVGQDGWTLPIPLVKAKAGWSFDTVAGAEEMRVRRIGRHEVFAIETLRTVLDAQREYAEVDRDGDGVLQYADRLVSSPKRHDGLFWPTVEGEPPSPLGRAFVGAEARNASPGGLLGYRYRLLSGQGKHARGGAFDYRVKGKLFGGFAVVAYPVKYGDTGVMTFIMNHEGEVFQRDLGPNGAKQAAALGRFDPGPGWTEVTP
ncbi:DUF2950 domain-containing protein [Piscinibacter gummiphilus]|uniref:Uncharacterized protein n=1 Tax=Piscinibacter gummiphilus TaxID=946333 RepID=A0A1W6L7P6_9BURK|nr:DUF2950 domain-containing protein [Piscinibacter gummiphilus]ARN20244.1 hypothetical protein A4W93_10205 [Piscinibacter gummiphilus]ATU64915.1 DUF2950 domain-containing protein [Piscinibacter gummiphilus]GLS96454.1 hypothetical protein GCM10007918_37460 [Piscinibacter gummiphilus]